MSTPVAPVRVSAPRPPSRTSLPLQLDLASVVPSLAGPRRPQDRVAAVERAHVVCRRAARSAEGREKGRRRRRRRSGRRRDAAGARLGRHRGDHELHEHVEPERDDRRRPRREEGASRRASRRKPWVKTSLAPGSKVVTEYLAKAGLAAVSRRSSASTSSATAARRASATAARCPTRSPPKCASAGLVVASVLSGNRNFEGRIQQDVRANYLASPPLVVAYALAGSMNVDVDDRAARHGQGRQAGLPEGHLADGAARFSRRC